MSIFITDVIACLLTTFPYYQPKSNKAFSLRLIFPHRNDNAIGPDIFFKDLSASKGNNPIHFFCHFFYTDENELLAKSHVA